MTAIHYIEFVENFLRVEFADQRVVSAPLGWYPRLSHATTQERNDWRVFQDSDERDIMLWESLDELIPVVALLTGTPSRESKRSFERWLAERDSK